MQLVECQDGGGDTSEVEVPDPATADRIDCPDRAEWAGHGLVVVVGSVDNQSFARPDRRRSFRAYC